MIVESGNGSSAIGLFFYFRAEKLYSFEMEIKPLHEWNLSPKQAIELQKQLAYEVIQTDKFDEPIKTVAGIDLGYDAKNDTSRAVVVVLTKFSSF